MRAPGRWFLLPLILAAAPLILLAQPASPPAPAAPAPAATEGKLTATLAKIDGVVLIRKAGTADLVPVIEGQALESGDFISTLPESTATIAFSDRSTIVVKEMTQLRMGALLTEAGKNKIEVLLKVGELKAQVAPRETLRPDFSIKTPVATASVRGTDKIVSYYPPRGMQTEVLTGKVLIESDRGRVEASKDDRSTVDTERELVTPAEIVQEGSRVRVEPVGLTQPEVEQISTFNQPQQTPSTGTAAESGTSGGSSTGGGTLIFRYVLQ
jgi:hypothetical protein